MKIDYLANTLGNFNDYVIVNYCASVRCEDDGAHFPCFIYNDSILLKNEEAKRFKTDDELFHMVVEHIKDNYKNRMGITLDEQMEDEAFEDITISISKEIHYTKQIKITK